MMRDHTQPCPPPRDRAEHGHNEMRRFIINALKARGTVGHAHRPPPEIDGMACEAQKETNGPNLLPMAGGEGRAST